MKNELECFHTFSLMWGNFPAVAKSMASVFARQATIFPAYAGQSCPLSFSNMASSLIFLDKDW